MIDIVGIALFVGGTAVSALMGFGPAYVLASINSLQTWKPFFLVTALAAMIPGLSCIAWSVTLPEEAAGWAFLLGLALNVALPWASAAVLGAVAFLMKKS